MHQELQRRGVPIISSVSEVLNAVFVSATPDRIAELEAIPGVIGVRPMRQMHLTLNKATQLMNAPVAWNLVGGQSKAGAGIKIGILDTGIDQTHAAFQDSSLAFPDRLPQVQRQRRRVQLHQHQGDCGAQLRQPDCGGQ